MKFIPILLCFDDRILIGAGVTIRSLTGSAQDDTCYEINIFHPGLTEIIKSYLQSLVVGTRHTMRFFAVQPERFAGLPVGRGSWTEVVYFRILASDILHDRSRVIYSDVDVFFKKDMSDVFSTDLTGIEWAGVAAETNTPEKIMHSYFPENTKDRIIFSGFMLMNLELMRHNKAVDRYFETARRIGDRLAFFDLDLLNIATPLIGELPFSYVVLEDIYETEDITSSPDFRYLRTVYTVAELKSSRDDAAIIHFAGRRGKPWQRRHTASYFQDVVASLPAGLQRFNLRNFRKKWLSRKGNRRFPTRTAN